MKQRRGDTIISRGRRDFTAKLLVKVRRLFNVYFKEHEIGPSLKKGRSLSLTLQQGQY